MSVAADTLRRKADDYRALGEEHCAPGDPTKALYVTIEVTLRELAEALDDDELSTARPPA